MADIAIKGDNIFESVVHHFSGLMTESYSVSVKCVKVADMVIGYAVVKAKLRHGEKLDEKLVEWFPVTFIHPQKIALENAVDLLNLVLANTFANKTVEAQRWES